MWFMSCRIDDRGMLENLSLIARTRMVWSLLYIAIAFSIKSSIPIVSFYAIIAVGIIGLISSLFFCRVIAKYPRFVRSFAYMSVVIDVIVLTYGIYQFGTYRTHKTEAYLMYFLMFEIASWNKDIDTMKIVITTWALGYVLTAYHTLMYDNVILGDITDSFTTEAISIENIVIKFILTGIVAFYVYKRVERYDNENG